MGDNSKIEWTEATWNPVTGCRKVSSSCKNCYAETMARVQSMRARGYDNGFEPTLHPERIKVGKRKAGRNLDGRTWEEFPC